MSESNDESGKTVKSMSSSLHRWLESNGVEVVPSKGSISEFVGCAEERRTLSYLRLLEEWGPNVVVIEEIADEEGNADD